jgi:putative restriction endonuclease
MRIYVGVTDFDWYRFLAGRAPLDEVNFWQPSGGVAFKFLQPGGLFLFKLHHPRNFIVGGAFFAHWSALPVSLAWETFGEMNGVNSLQEMRARLAKYRKVADDHRTDYIIGCILLEQPFFLPESQWIPVPGDWARNIVRGKGYDAENGEGRRLWERLSAVSTAVTASVIPPSPFEPQPVHERYGQPTLVYPRLGQGSFRILVTDIYERRCAVTGERTLPVLNAAHIKPYGLDGPHDPQNGLLLRSDLHTLFDRGYVTVTPDLRFKVSRRIREEFENGGDYYKLDGQDVRSPIRRNLAPASHYLEWHGIHVFRG